MFKKGIAILSIGCLLTGCSQLQPNQVDIQPTEETEEKKEDTMDEQTQLELLNIMNDLDTFIEANNQELEELKAIEKGETTLTNDEEEEESDTYTTEELTELFSKNTDSSESKDEGSSTMSDEEKKKKSYLVMDDYIHKIYQLSAARLSADIEDVYIYSENYMSYLALLQTFVDSYTENEEEFREQLTNGDEECLSSDVMETFSNVESYYMNLYKGLEN